MASSIGKRIKHLAHKATGKKRRYDRHRFSGNEAQNKYTQHYCTKAIVVERCLDFDDYAIYHLSTVRELERRGWPTFLSQQGQVCEELVREFYSNLKDIQYYDDGPHISTKLRGRDYIIGPAHFATILHLPAVANPEYHYGDLYDTSDLLPIISKSNKPWIAATYPQQDLKDDFRILNIVSTSSLIPQKRTSDLTVERATLLAAIMTGKTICARTLIGEVMNSHLTNVHNPAALPFGLFITKCAIQDGIRIHTSESMLSQEKPIDENTLHRSTSQKKRTKTAEQMGHATDTPGSSSSIDISARLDALTLRFEQEQQANANWREFQRKSMEQEQAAAASWRESQRHSIDIMQSEMHQMYYNQQRWGAWMSSQWEGFPPG